MGLLNLALGGLAGKGMGNGGMGAPLSGLLPMLMQQQGGGAQGSPMAPPSRPPMMPGGMMAPGGPGGQRTPFQAGVGGAGPPDGRAMLADEGPGFRPSGPSGGMGGGMPGSFGGNPQFMQQLQQMMAMQGPGRGPMQFTPPPGGPINTQIPGVTPIAPGGGDAGGQQMNPQLLQMLMAQRRMGGMQQF